MSSYEIPGADRPSRPPMGIVAPGPRVQIGVKQGDSFQIRPGEPLNLFVVERVGASHSLVSAATESAYIIKPSTLPAGTPAVRGPGHWFEISLMPGAKPAGKEEIRVQSKAVAPHATPHTELTFTLTAGDKRFY